MIGIWSVLIPDSTSHPKWCESMTDPVTIELHQESLVIDSAYPNPFSTQMQFEFISGIHAPVSIEVYDLLGHQVRTLFNGTPSLHKPVRVTVSSENLHSA